MGLPRHLNYDDPNSRLSLSTFSPDFLHNEGSEKAENLEHRSLQ